uniref:Leucine-rich repeat-containing protein 51 n=1 Tax=Chrysotila carterae TaxID=13221 RepID=A0A7S4B3C9_CHRCT
MSIRAAHLPCMARLMAPSISSVRARMTSRAVGNLLPAKCRQLSSSSETLGGAHPEWATSLSQAVRRGTTHLRLRESEELICGEPCCAAFGKRCLCRLSMFLERLSHIKHLDLSKCELDRLPEVWRMPQLETLDVSDNLLDDLPVELASAAKLRAVRAVGNPLTKGVSPQLQALVVEEIK